MQARQDAVEQNDIETFKILTKQFRQSKQRDKKDYIMSTLSADLDTRNRWIGIKALKKEYKPTPYHRKTKMGATVALEETAEAFAKQLEEQIWNQADPPTHLIDRCKIPRTEDLQYNLSAITVDEIQEVIRKFKRNKATGPDEIPIEIFKELETRALEHIATALNIWWDDEAIEEEHLRATICLIYKKR